MKDVMKTLRRQPGILVGLSLFGLYLVLRWYVSLPTAPDMTLTPPQDREPFGIDITLPSLHGDSLHLAHLRGQVILVNFWATWCHPCRAEMPSMQALYEAYRARGFTIVAIATDSQGSSVVAPFTQSYDLTFPILLDPENTIGTQMQLQGIPTTFLLDKRGRIAGLEVGARDWYSPRFQRALDTLLAEESTRNAS